MKKRYTVTLMSVCFGIAGALGLAAAYVTLEEAFDPGRRVTRHIDRELPARGRAVRVEGPVSRLVVEAGPDGVVKLSADLSTRRHVPAGADKEAGSGPAAPDIDIAETDDRITIRPRLDGASRERRILGLFTISLDDEGTDMTLTVPRGTALDVDNRYGDITVRGVLGPATLRNTSGQIEVNGAAGPVTIENSYGDVVLSHIDGPVRVTGQSGGIVLTDAQGDADVETSYGSVEIRRLDGSLSATATSGDLIASGISGDLSAHCTYGRVAAEDIGGRLTIEGESGDVEAARIAGDARITTSYGGIGLHAVGGAVMLRNESGPIEVNGLYGGALAADHRVETSYAEIRFHWPRDAGVSYDLETTNGDIACDLPGVLREEPGVRKLAGSLGDGRARVALTSRNGGIELVAE